MDILDWISITSGVVSIILAISAIIMSTNSEKRSLTNFQQTQKLIEELRTNVRHFEEISNRVLSEIDKKTERIEQISSDTKADVHDNIRRVFEYNFPNQEQQSQNQMMGLLAPLLQNPEILKMLITMSKNG